LNNWEILIDTSQPERKVETGMVACATANNNIAGAPLKSTFSLNKLDFNVREVLASNRIA